MTARTSQKRRTVVRMDDCALRHSELVYGPTRIVNPVLRKLSIPWQYDHMRHAHKIPKKRADDLAAALDAEGYVVEVTLAGWR